MRKDENIVANQCGLAAISSLWKPDVELIPLFLSILLMITNFAYSQSPISVESAMANDHLDSVEIESFVDSLYFTLADSFHVPGLVISIVHVDQLILSKGYANADLTKKIQMTPHTAVRAGSVSKPITATAVIQFIEQGKIDP